MAGFSEIAARLGGWPRRVAALLCLMLAAAAAASARSARAHSAAERAVVVATRDLPVGSVLGARDVRVARWPAGQVPAGAVVRLADAVGRRLAAPLRAQDLVSTTWLAGAGVASGLPPGQVAITVRLGSVAAGLVRPGDVVDLLAAAADQQAAGGSARATIVAEAVRVLAVLPAGAGSSDPSRDVDLIIAVDRVGALAVAALGDRPVLAAVRNPP